MNYLIRSISFDKDMRKGFMVLKTYYNPKTEQYQTEQSLLEFFTKIQDENTLLVGTHKSKKKAIAFHKSHWEGLKNAPASN